LLTLIISGEKCKLWTSSLCSYLPSLATSSHFALNKLKCLSRAQFGFRITLLSLLCRLSS
jgi:hypothetical protein